jgi:hypothetical protein
MQEKRDFKPQNVSGQYQEIVLELEIVKNNLQAGHLQLKIHNDRYKETTIIQDREKIFKMLKEAQEKGIKIINETKIKIPKI